MSRARSVSEPSLPVYCSSYTRERVRKSDVEYEKGKDKLAHWIGAWSQEQVCEMLQALVARCPLRQLEYLWTAMESFPHRDFIHTSNVLFQPLSTPLSREITVRLRRSRRPENKRLHRVQSAVINSEISAIRSETQLVQRYSVPEATTMSRLPGLQGQSPPQPLSWPDSPLPPPSRSRARTTQPTPLISLTSGNRPRTHTTGHSSMLRTRGRSPLQNNRVDTPPTRVLTPMRRHMRSQTGPISPKELIASLERSAPSGPLSPSPAHILPLKRAFLSHADTQPKALLNADMLDFLTWFSRLTQDWQQQELLQLIISNLDHKELYFLSALLMSRQYRDFLSRLPQALTHKILLYVSSKDILRHCCRVSKSWNEVCSSELFWKEKCCQGRLGLPMTNFLSWKRLYIDDLALKKNWWRGRHVARTLHGHSKNVLCVRLNGDLVATGSADHSVRLWRLSTGECLTRLHGHSKAVWSVCFYGNSLLISGSSDGSIKVWNHRTGVCERTLDGRAGPVWALQQKNEVLISGNHEKVALLWDIRHCRLSKKLTGHQGIVFAVDLDDTSQHAFTASGDKTVRQWEVATGLCLRLVRVSKLDPVMALHWDKGYLVCCHGNVITLWMTSDWSKVRQFKGHEDRVESVRLRLTSRVGQATAAGTVVSASRDRTVKYWDINSGRCIQTLRGHESRLNATDSDAIRIVSAAEEPTVRVWDFHPHNNF